jgi:lycopene beta-cyclase
MSEHLIFVGGGLANSLLAYRLRQRRPEVKLTLIERGDAIGGNHTWSFHGTDVAPEARAWLDPFVARSWPVQEVRFASHRRKLETEYATVTSERLRERVGALDGVEILTGAAVTELAPSSVALADGRRIVGTAVIDGRGFPRHHGLRLGWQKFHGIEVRTQGAHGLAAPILMDARVPQLDGYRFIYSLPLSSETLLIEDTRYSDTPDIDVAAYRAELEAYAIKQGWRVAETLREETGALPVAMGGSTEAFHKGRGDVAVSGLAAGLFHPTTGYSLPDAVRMADIVSRLDDLSPRVISRAMLHESRTRWRRRGFFRMLNRMLFQAAAPHERHRIFERFYTLDIGLIERFYADRLTTFDMLRILTGKPPVPIGRAISAILSGAQMPFRSLEGALKR